jgi:hypothetical protein
MAILLSILTSLESGVAAWLYTAAYNDIWRETKSQKRHVGKTPSKKSVTPLLLPFGDIIILFHGRTGGDTHADN